MLHVLTVVFIVLKLTGVIAWSWWLVFLPTLLMLIPVLVLIARRVGAHIFDNWKRKKADELRRFVEAKK